MRVLSRLAVISVALAASLVSADGEPVAHEYVPDLESDEGTLVVSSGGDQPDAIVYNGELLPRPMGGGLRGDEQPMRPEPGDGGGQEEAGRRSASFRPDRVTHLNGTVGYYAVFSPSIAPFKRVTALDRVLLAPDGAPVLSVADPHRATITPVGAGAPSPDGLARDRFWGSLVLQLPPGGGVVPLPSVSPDSRILSVETEPSIELRVERDGADNYFASSPVGHSGQVRVVFLTDAPRSYFGRAIPDGPVDVLRAEVPALPPSVQRDALTFAAELGLSRASGFREALEQLTRHFRSFEESVQPPQNRGNIFLDLARGRRGICRHRAYGFVITAQALGMHARFVQNEAHAWVEVQLPADAGWLRIDLGGAATGLEARGARDRPNYEPSLQETLPRPEEYERAYEEARRMSGLRPRERRVNGQSGADGPTGATSGGSDSPNPGSGAAGSAAQGEPAPDPPANHVPVPPAPGSPARGVLTLRLDATRFEVFRGRELEITGSALGRGRGVSGLRVEVALRTSSGDRERLLGVTVTDDGGRFRAVLGVPPELSVGDYLLVVRTPGDSAWSAAVAR